VLSAIGEAGASAWDNPRTSRVTSRRMWLTTYWNRSQRQFRAGFVSILIDQSSTERDFGGRGEPGPTIAAGACHFNCRFREQSDVFSALSFFFLLPSLVATERACVLCLIIRVLTES
jgi:hypothetical protein